MLRKAKTSAPGIALDTISLLFNRGLSATTTTTELMLRCDSSAQGSHLCSCLLNLQTVVRGVTLKRPSCPDSCRTVISLTMAEFFLANRCLTSGKLASALARLKPAVRLVGWAMLAQMFWIVLGLAGCCFDTACAASSHAWHQLAQKKAAAFK